MRSDKILYISTAKNRDDRSEWSGTVYHSLLALEHVGYEVYYVNALEGIQQDIIDKIWVRYWCWIANRFKKNVRFDESYYTMRMMRRVLAKIDYSKFDIIFVPTDMCIVTALPKTVRAKIIHLVDAPVQSLFDYYTEFSNLTRQNRIEASWITKRAFRRADLIIASSNWCKSESTIQCGISPSKIEVVEFGANINDKDIPLLKKSYTEGAPLNIYWSGVNWVRKGGDVAYDACRELRQRGIDAQFHITGMRELPAEIASQPWVHNHGFLNKNNTNEYRHLIEIMSRQHIFLFPSRAECSSIALCEANAFGLPCFVYDTGGTANYVLNGYNGHMLHLSATGQDFAEQILKAVQCYSTFSCNARRQYEEKLNWAIWSDKVKNVISKMNDK